MLSQSALRAAAVDLWHYHAVYFDYLEDAVAFTQALGEESVLSTAGSLWAVTLPRNQGGVTLTGKAPA